LPEHSRTHRRTCPIHDVPLGTSSRGKPASLLQVHEVGTRDFILPYLTQVPPSICTSAVCTCTYVCVMQGQGHHPYHCATATSESPPHHTDSPRGVECSRYSREENIQGQARVLPVFLSAQWKRVFFYLLNGEGCIVPCQKKGIYIFLTRLYSTDLR